MKPYKSRRGDRPQEGEFWLETPASGNGHEAERGRTWRLNWSEYLGRAVLTHRRRGLPPITAAPGLESDQKPVFSVNKANPPNLPCASLFLFYGASLAPV